MDTLEPLGPPDRGDVREPLRRHVISAAVLVAAGGVLFALVGLVRSPAPTPQPQIAAQGSDNLSESPSEDGIESPDPTASAAVTDEAIPSASVTAAEPDPVTTPTPTPTPTPTSTPTPSTSPSQASGRIDPSTISIQVLDAVRDDSMAAANKVAAELKADDYRVVVVNSASKVYEVTTVMFSPGFEAQARQIAADYGYRAVQPKPDNLTSSVQIHLVVGLDAR